MSGVYYGLGGHWSRRELGHLLAFTGLAALAPSIASAGSQRTAQGGPDNMSNDLGTYYAYVGARTTRERNARGNGLNVFRTDGKDRPWTQVQLLESLVNPSFLAFDRTQRFLYTVHGDLSEITAFSIDDKTGKLTQINQQSTQGKNPVHLAIDPTNRFFVVANHITSTLALLPREEDGSLGPVVDLVKLEGKIGPHRIEQPFAKPHQVEFDPTGRFIVVPDKGLDVVFTYRLDVAAKKLLPVGNPAQARESSGPRHVVFGHGGKTAYVINELDSTVTAYRFDASSGALEPFQIVSSLPETFTGNSRASEIGVSPDGRFLYASNRGYDSIAIFSVQPETGRLASLGWQTTDGRTPRFFAIEPTGRFMFVANEESDTIVPFEINSAEGTLRRSGEQTRIGSPVCILFKKAS